MTRTSTQEDAWLVLAARALGRQNITLDVNQGGASRARYYSTYGQADIEESEVTVDQ